MSFASHQDVGAVPPVCDGKQEVFSVIGKRGAVHLFLGTSFAVYFPVFLRVLAKPVVVQVAVVVFFSRRNVPGLGYLL